MPQVLVRDVPKPVLARLKARARRDGRSLQAELRAILVKASEPDLFDSLAAADRIRAMLAGRTFSQTGTESIREDRDR
jgi:plasmid stability protein